LIARVRYAALLLLAFAPYAWAADSTDKSLYTVDAVRDGTLADFAVRGLVQGADGKEILPGITCYTGGKHTYASQYVGESRPQKVP
jgi:hypothetical protein